MAGQRSVGDYVLTQTLGKGSFAVVWKAQHKRTGAEVAIKEIASEELTRKLCENLMSEINILKKINHPNIIRLYDTIVQPELNRIYLVLEFCAGGDLGAYISKHGKVSEATARHFMRHLGAGLQVLQANNLIHRDLKPQNLLLSTNDTNAVLKIADFGFARSLQPQGMAETLCGSPLYMAPEILQSRKYNAKADLWSVGTILYQLVTGQPPFTGQSPHQLLQNILSSTKLHFPSSVQHPECKDLCCRLLRKDPVARLSFEEFFSHKFIAEPIRQAPNLPFSVEPRSSQEDIMPFPLDVDPPFVSASSKGKANLTPKAALPAALQGFDNLDPALKLPEKKGIRTREIDTFHNVVDASWKANKGSTCEGLRSEQHGSEMSLSKGVMIDSMEVIEKEYVLVSVPVTSTDAISFSESDQFTCVGHQPSYKVPQKLSAVKAMASGSCGTAEVSQGRLAGPVCEADILTRLHVLHKCAETIEDLARKECGASRHLEAFSLYLTCLAVWKEALSISCRKAGTSDIRGAKLTDFPLDFLHLSDDEFGAETLRSRVEQSFCKAVEQAEIIAPHVQCLDGSTEIPDPMEMIYQAALTIGRHAAVDELMGKLPKAAAAYCKAATMLYFLLVEASALPISPRLLLGDADRHRLHNYITIIASRQSLCAAEKANFQR